MTILVKNNYLSYGGKLYEPGASVEVDDKTAKALIKNGDFVVTQNVVTPVVDEIIPQEVSGLPAPDMTETVAKGAKK